LNRSKFQLYARRGYGEGGHGTSRSCLHVLEVLQGYGSLLRSICHLVYNSLSHVLPIHSKSAHNRLHGKPNWGKREWLSENVRRLLRRESLKWFGQREYHSSAISRRTMAAVPSVIIETSVHSMQTTLLESPYISLPTDR